MSRLSLILVCGWILFSLFLHVLFPYVKCIVLCFLRRCIHCHMNNHNSPTFCICYVTGNQTFGLIQISEAMDIRTRQGLLNALAGKSGKRMDSLLVPLELLCCVSRTEFSDKKAYLRWQKRQVKTPSHIEL